jgi:hypothetical protein
MNEKSAWREKLLIELGTLLARYGFKFIPSSRSYQRATATGWHSVHLALIDHPTDFDVVVDVGIRFDAIQRQLDGGADKRARAATIGCEYGNLIGTGQHRWPIAAASDVSPTARDIVKACETSLFPFFEAFSDLATVCDALRADDAQARLLMPLADYRRSIVAAAEELLQHRTK